MSVWWLALFPTLAFTQPCADHACDSAVVRLILDANGRQDKEVTDVSEVSEGRIAGIHMQYLGLDTLPPEVGRLSALTHLGLDRNDLPALPGEIGQLSSLASLLLDNNRLTSLPAEIGNLDSLQWLVLFSNFLVSVPREIGRLSSLRHLQIEDNRLSYLPGEIGSLAALEKLSLSHNELAQVPEQIGQLITLREFLLNDNHLTDLPPWVSKLAPVQGLDVRNNRLCHLTNSVETWVNKYSTDLDWKPTQKIDGRRACPVLSIGRGKGNIGGKAYIREPGFPFLVIFTPAASGKLRTYGLQGSWLRIAH